MKKQTASSAYSYPLLIRRLLDAALVVSPDQEIVSGDLCRYSYRTFRQRIARLASGLTSSGIEQGDTVAVMDWDSHRYLECFFGVPMMGAVLHTINIRLSPEQILYTINHAEDDIILVHSDFIQIINRIYDRIVHPVPLVELRVVDENMNDLPIDEKTTGEVVIRTPWLTQGYTGDAEGSDQLWQGNYLHTGDVGYIDGTGSLRITDRMKDVIKSGGEWISSLQLENIASQCEGVGEVAAIGIPDQRWGERPLLIVTRSPECARKVSAEDIKNAIRVCVDNGNLSRWAVPERVEFVDAIEKTSVGKLDKKTLRALYSRPVE